MNIDDFFNDGIVDDSVNFNTGPIGIDDPLGTFGLISLIWAFINLLIRLIRGTV